MAVAKYKQYYQSMVEQNKQGFAAFKLVHDGFTQSKVTQENYNKKGLPIVDIIRDWDRRLCSAMGKGAFSKYSEQLSEKFWNEVRKEFPLIDKVGVKVKK
ncbi:MAG: hypothetical protein GW942_00185 [Candidatus Pacebacteria bacterium]|nr:hypothetical protein [Candidatus Paceibacterota bacterium]